MPEHACAWPREPLDRVAPGVFWLRPGPELCSGPGVLFGGWSLAAAVDAAQQASGRPLRDLALNFLSPVGVGDRLELRTATLAASGTVAHVRLDAAVDGRTVFAGMAVTGAPDDGRRDAAGQPAVPPPEQCPPRAYAAGPATPLADLLDIRVASEDPADPTGARALLWGRVRESVADAVALAVLSDHVPYLLKRCLPAVTDVVSISASLRATGEPVGEWVLLDVGTVASGRRFAVGRIDLWSRGRLVAVGQQTARLFRAAGVPTG